MKIQRFILLFTIMSVLLAACASSPTPERNPPMEQEIPTNIPTSLDTPLLIWQRNGGIAGFCDTVTILASGEYTVENCSAQPPTRSGQLDIQQRNQLGVWVTTFKSFEDGEDNATPSYPDQMFVKTSFTGSGSMQAIPEQIREISNFAASLAAAQPTPAAQQPALASGTTPEAAIKARDFLAAQLNIPADEIEIVSVEAVEWSDSCLGLGQPDQLCAQMITPGYKVMLEASGRTYEAHTNESGDVVLLAP